MPEPGTYETTAPAAVVVHATHVVDVPTAVTPADTVARSHLKAERGLNDQSARSLLTIYKENLAFADLKPDVMIPGTDEGESEEARDDLLPPPPLKGKVRPMDGERVLTTGLLSKDASFRLIVSGNVGVKEIERLIKKLELDKEILAENDQSDESAGQ